MDHLNNLIGFGWPNAVIRIKRAKNSVDGDPWPGVEDSDDAMQAVLDDCVEWVKGAKKPTGKQVRAKLAEWRASIRPPVSEPDDIEVLKAALRAKGTVTDADLENAKRTLMGS